MTTSISSTAAGPRVLDEDLIAGARARKGDALSGRDRITSVALGGGFLVSAVAMAALMPWGGSLSLAWAGSLILFHAVASRVEFEIGSGSAVPTQLVLVPMLFMLPPAVVPLCVAAGYLLGAIADHLTGRIHPQRAFVLLSSSWHAVAPALVLTLAGSDSPRWSDWPVYLVALGAQFLFDFASSTGREWLAFRVRPAQLLPFLGWVYAIDALLAPVGLLAVFAVVEGTAFAFLLSLPLLALLALLARDRRTRINRAVEFNDAYRGANRQARLDVLTGLANRLAWEEAIAREEASPSPHPVSIILIDVDQLKLVNDTLGHACGDEFLRALASVLPANVRERDLVARLGGDEVGVLMPETTEAACREVASRIAAALRAHPGVSGFRLVASLGFATREPGGSLAETQRAADARMYLRRKRVRLASSKRQSAALLHAVLQERDAELAEHVREVRALARAVGRRLGLTIDQLDEVALAAELHDIGKLAVPVAILEKPGPLAPTERATIERHPVVGERIMAAVPELRPAARLVRASHERCDGCGYPDGLPGEAIPLGARILAVCDAFAAMTSERAYACPMSAAEAVAELRRCAGTQFDPVVVEKFCETLLTEDASPRGNNADAGRDLDGLDAAGCPPRAA